MNVFEVYRDNLCKNCKNKTSNLCEIRQLIDGTVKCTYYERKEKLKGYKEKKRMTVTAKRNKPIMKGIEK